MRWRKPKAAVNDCEMPSSCLASCWESHDEESCRSTCLQWKRCLRTRSDGTRVHGIARATERRVALLRAGSGFREGSGVEGVWRETAPEEQLVFGDGVLAEHK